MLLLRYSVLFLLNWLLLQLMMTMHSAAIANGKLVDNNEGHHYNNEAVKSNSRDNLKIGIVSVLDDIVPSHIGAVLHTIALGQSIKTHEDIISIPYTTILLITSPPLVTMTATTNNETNNNNASSSYSLSSSSSSSLPSINYYYSKLLNMA